MAIEFDRKKFGQNLRKARLSMGFTIRELASLAGISKTSLLHTEQGRDSIHYKTIDKALRALQVSFEDMLNYADRKTDHIVGIHHPFIAHHPQHTFWLLSADHRAKRPENTYAMIQDPNERLRLGRLGFVPLFANSPDFLMPHGPGLVELELYGRFESAYNRHLYHHAVMYVISGEVRFEFDEGEVVLAAGGSLGLSTELRFSMEPSRPIGLNEPPARLIWVGANRTGNVQQTFAKRPLNKKEPSTESESD